MSSLFPGDAEKSSISLFINIPVPFIVTPEPKVEFKVYVDDTTFPFLSATEKWVVSVLSLSSNEPGNIFDEGVDLPILILFLILLAYFLLVISNIGTSKKSGSPKCFYLSAYAYLITSANKFM